MQKVLRGAGSLSLLSRELQATPVQKFFLLTGNHFTVMYKRELFPEIQVQHVIKSGVNVSVDEAEQFLEQFSRAGCSGIIAIGGGSVIDLAKAIIYLSGNAIPFVAVPTTAGSGSEATPFAVVYREGKKESWMQDLLLPSIVVLDPELVFSLPAYQVACTGMDCLSQAVESYWSKNSNSQSRSFSKKAIATWIHSFQRAVEGDTQAKSDMLYAAYEAGRAIAITRTTGPHALSYLLSSRYNVTHGQAVALFLPLFFRYNQPGNDLCSLLHVENANEAAEWLTKQMKQAGLQTDLNGLGIDRDAILEQLLAEVNEERFANNPVGFDRAALTTLIKKYL